MGSTSQVRRREKMKGHASIIIIILVCKGVLAAHPSQQLPAVSADKNGKLVYATDVQGNRVPDFSYCGYRAGDEPIPDVPVRIVVPVGKGDATVRIQAALDYVASLPLNNGVRGAVLLEKGSYEVAGSLKIGASGVILRGSGMHESGTVLTGTGLSRETLIRIEGGNDRETGPAAEITQAYVPVNATKITVKSPHPFKSGDAVLVHRPSVKPWIQILSMEEFGGETGWLGWKPGQRDLYWDRKIVSIEDSVITLDAPLTTALDAAYGGGNIRTYRWPGRISNTGVENLLCVSTHDKRNLKDEDHRWMAITMENVSDAWVRQVAFRHFAGSAVALFGSVSRVTVEDCIALEPVSEIGGQRRYTFFTSGQQTLFQRLYAEQGYHDFAVGFCAPGPNAFVQCESYLPYSFSGTIDSWASGVLFDVVHIDGQALGFANRRQDAQGAGWTAANSVLWQCAASRIDCYKPPTAMNWAMGTWGQFAGDGYWYESNSHIKPRSLYYAQLAERLGDKVLQRAHLLPAETEASSSPTVAQAAALAAGSNAPAPSLKDWIGDASRRQPISTNATKVKNIDQIGFKIPVTLLKAAPMEISGGWITREKAVVAGRSRGVQWWRGNVRPSERKSATPHVTRFVPGRTGHGLTDDLDELTSEMKKNNVTVLEHNYGLWYDRRRDDHERIRRMDGEVWPPFYELPFARSGKGTAWDGLSKYDLTRYNPWYWDRLKAFADQADEKGLVLVHQHYFQHNILEAGAHWADFPWRSANNVNDTGFPEPPPYAGDKRIFMADAFYDITHPARRALHRAYIRQCLESFAANGSVIHLIGAEYTGPLHFAQFWIDTISEWEKETGKEAIVGVSTTKDVQDALLADPVRASVIDVIDIRYWHYREDGSVYAPGGGQNLAPRQHARLVKPGSTSFGQVFRAVSEYRQKFPGKAVMYSAEGGDHFAWAVLMAGGSLPALPVLDRHFLEDAAAMSPVTTSTEGNQWMIAHPKRGMIVFSRSSGPVYVDLKETQGSFRVRWIDPDKGTVIQEDKAVKGGDRVEFKRPQQGDLVLWLSANLKSEI